MKTKLKLGTRKSLLAWSQSQWVAHQVERLNPGVQVELFGIETRGDRVLDVSLQSMEGKEFFVAEIDEALVSGAVDFTVHSLKDLSLDRPPALVSAATPRRENPRDVVLFGPHALSRLRAGKILKIGTSSPRRIENIPSFLRKALPQFETAPQLDFVEIRGNVNTRLSRVQESQDSPKYLDAVVLAFAGIIRLWANPAGQVELQRLLTGVRWMVLPLKECPAAPGQGALAIECRVDDPGVRKILKTLHHEPTARSVAAERQLLADWGGGCHQRFGATAIDRLGQLLYIQGKIPDGTSVGELRWQFPPFESPASGVVCAWDGSLWREKAKCRGGSLISTETSAKTSTNGAVTSTNGAVTSTNGGAAPLASRFPETSVFVAHSRALVQPQGQPLRSAGLQARLEGARLWTSGTASWFRLAANGYWVEGCAEGLGFEELSGTLKEPVLRLGELQSWTVLTHSEALAEWSERGIPAISTYTVNLDYGNDAKTLLKAATHVFWSSGSQYDELKENLPTNAVVACGPGYTAMKLRKAGLNPVVFPSVEEWKTWLKIF